MGTRDVTSFHLLSHFGHTFNCIFTGCHGMSRDFPGIPVTKGVLQRVEHNCKYMQLLKSEMYNRLEYLDDYLIDYDFLIVIVIVITQKIFKNNRNHNRNHLKKFRMSNRNRNRKISKNSIF